MSPTLNLAMVVLAALVANSLGMNDKVTLTNGKASIVWERVNNQLTSKRHADDEYSLRCMMSRGVPDFESSQDHHKVVLRSEEAFKEDARRCIDHERRRRQIMAGTLWCGNGDNAESYDQVGYFSNVDKCCRAHDHCERYVVASDTAYGVTNPTSYTWSDCKCDDDFRSCLHKINSYMSNFVGAMFFDVVTTSKCIEFDENDPTKATAVNKGSYETREKEASWWNWLG